MFVDTLQGHYTGFAEDMYTPYQEWRKASYEETVALRELEAESQREMTQGGAAISQVWHRPPVVERLEAPAPSVSWVAAHC